MKPIIKMSIFFLSLFVFGVLFLLNTIKRDISVMGILFSVAFFIKYAYDSEEEIRNRKQEDGE